MSEETKNDLNSVSDDKKIDFDKCLEAAEQGDAEAQYMVGKCYLTGEGTEKNKIIAFRWFKKSAEQGHAKAQYETGLCYLEGKGTEVESLEWYKKAAEQGYAEAQYKVGNAYYCGKGVEKDKNEAFKWFLLAAEQGQADAQYMVGKCYYNGNGVKENKAEAFKWYKKASEQENFSNKLSNTKFIGNALKIFAVQFGLGKCYWNGAGVPVDEAEAVKWWGRAVLAVLKLSVIGIPAVVLSLSGPALILFFIGSLLWNVYSAAVPNLIEKAKRPYYDYVMCKEAREENSSESWERYLENYPDGKCAEEAKAFQDITACERAKEENTRASWESYLEYISDGKCAEEARAVIKKFKKVGNLEWSNIAKKENWKAAEDYCKQLNEDGYSDWRLPNIDELKRLVKNCPEAEPGGECKISEKNNCLSGEDCRCERCVEMDDGHYSKLGDDYVSLCSSSVHSDDADSRWGISFRDAGMFNSHLTEGVTYCDVRCVRQDDHDACATARSEDVLYYWRLYLERFPNGECAAEAKAFPEKKNKEICANAKNNSEEIWISYLRNFPEGSCAAEAKAFLDKSFCEKAKERNNRAGWERYLKDFPDGKCAEAAKATIKKLKKVGKLEWSNISEKVYSFEEATDYCKQLTEDGHSDWRLPNIDELRILIKNCPETETGGECNLSEKNDCLSGDDCRCENCEIMDNNGGYYSKLGDDDHVWLWSSSQTHVGIGICEKWGVFFGKGEISESCIAVGHYVRCVRQEDKDACEIARKYNELYYWKHYLKNFPDGKCVNEANVFLEKESAKDESGSQDNLIWSHRSSKNMNWNHAKQYCEDLREGGFTDWRLPNIDELRTLIKNCPKTEPGGECRISEKNRRLSSEDWYPGGSCSCGDNGGYSKLGDDSYVGLWASSVVSDDFESAWYVYFFGGLVNGNKKSDNALYVRCVR